jgi:hypothetical protein
MPLTSFDLFRFILLFISIMSRAQCKAMGFDGIERHLFVHRTSGLLAAAPCGLGPARLVNSDTVPVGVTALEDTSARIEWDANLQVRLPCIGRMYHSIG